MPHYLIEATYTTEGAGGISEKGGTARRDAVDQMLTGVGGKMESFYFAFGKPDVYVIAELPTDEVAASLSLAINQTDTTTLETRVLLTPEQIDSAAEMAPDYKPPGS